MENLPAYDAGPSQELNNQMHAYNMSISSLFSNTSTQSTTSTSSSPANVKKTSKNSGHDAFKLEYESMFPGIKRSSKGDGFFYCTYCQKDLKFTSRGPYDITTHTNRPRHIAFVQQCSSTPSGSTCNICNRRYKDHRSLNTHKRIEHSSCKRSYDDNEFRLDRVLCETCNRTYKDERSLRSHQRIEHGIYLEKPRKSNAEIGGGGDVTVPPVQNRAETAFSSF